MHCCDRVHVFATPLQEEVFMASTSLMKTFTYVIGGVDGLPWRTQDQIPTTHSFISY